VRLVVALGGNALLVRGERAEVETQRRNVEAAAAVIAELARHHRVVITHGNGPQVGLLALQTAAYRDVRPYPLDVLGAESEGMIGYLIEQAVGNRLPPGLAVATLLTQVIVDADDPAFRAPTKPIGPVYGEQEARRLAAERGFAIAPDGDGFRRVVPSPEPRDIVELRTLELLVEGGVVVICAGGGGIPVVVGPDGALHGVEAVIDKDLAAALLARLLHFDGLVMLTDVPGAMRRFGTPEAEVIRETTPAELRRLEFPAGSMGPKVEAACRFVDATGGRAWIGALGEAAALLEGRSGTTVTPPAA
jgi:carbamate kinase